MIIINYFILLLSQSNQYFIVTTITVFTTKKSKSEGLMHKPPAGIILPRIKHTTASSVHYPLTSRTISENEKFEIK